MRVLFILAKDSSNFAGSKIMAAFLKAGHEVLAYAEFMEEVNIRMVLSYHIEVHDIAALTDEIVETCDVMFSHSVYRWNDRIRTKKYTFFFNHIYVYGHENNSDFVFTQCDDPYNTFPNKAVMKIGSPKFDCGDRKNIIPADRSRNILFIETGHFPFGEKGRRQVAKLILDVCRRFPEFHLVVKPRFLPEDNRNLTRRNSDHMYNYLYQMSNNCLPPNLELLNRHRDLEEMICRSHSVVCYGTSSYLEAAISGRGLIIVDGIESEDIIADRKEKYWKYFNQYIEDTGCVVPYEKVLDYLPDGIICSDIHLKKALCSRENTAEKIVDAVEFVWKNFLSQNKFPEAKNYAYDTFKAEMQADENLTKKELIVRNRYDVLVYLIQKSERQLSADGFFDAMYDKIKIWRECGRLEAGCTGNGNIGENGGIKILVRELTCEIQKNIVANKERLMGDKIDEVVLLRGMDSLKMTEELLKLDRTKLLADEAYCFYVGKQLFMKKQYKKMLPLLKDYFQYLQNIKYDESFLCHSNPMVAAFNMMVVGAYHAGAADEIQQFVQNIRILLAEKGESLKEYLPVCIKFYQDLGECECAEILKQYMMEEIHEDAES
ncbi:hypothetical protein [Hungatella hathewayi]|uniref:hypothetical protein n=1 Tax=Hungatella hathewayi TaxID=154046 RepID=UPI003563B525